MTAHYPPKPAHTFLRRRKGSGSFSRLHIQQARFVFQVLFMFLMSHPSSLSLPQLPPSLKTLIAHGSFRLQIRLQIDGKPPLSLSPPPTPTGDSGGSSISSPRGHGLKRQSGRETARRGREKGRREQVAQTVASNISGPELLRGIFRTSLLHVPAPPLVSTNYASSLYLDRGRS